MSNISIITVKNVDHSCIMYNISKSKAFHLLENSVLEDRENIKKYCLNFESVFIYLVFFV